MRTLLVAIIAAAGMIADTEKSLFVDPATRWISLHDKDGTGAALEFSRDFQKTCPSIPLTNRREFATYSVTVERNGYNSGNVAIYVDGRLKASFRPGHAATLQRVADQVCSILTDPHH